MGDKKVKRSRLPRRGWVAECRVPNRSEVSMRGPVSRVARVCQSVRVSETSMSARKRDRGGGRSWDDQPGSPGKGLGVASYRFAGANDLGVEDFMTFKVT